MPPQIPSPIIAGGGGGQDPGTQLLMGLVSQAPDLIFDILERRRRSDIEQQQGKASLAALEGFAPQLGPQAMQAIQAAGGQVQPGVPAGSAPATDITGPVTTSGSEPGLDLSGIDPRMGSFLQEKIMEVQKGAEALETEEARQGLIEAQTTQAEAQTEGALLENEVTRIKRDFQQDTSQLRRRRAELENDLLEAQIAGQEAQARQAREQISNVNQREERLTNQAIAQEARAMRSEFGQNLDTYSQFPSVTQAEASTLASMATFGTPTRPDPSQLRQRAEGILTGDFPDPSEEEQRIEFAGRLGLTPQQVQVIDQNMARFDSAQEAFDAFVGRVKSEEGIEEERRNMLIAGGAAYMNRFGDPETPIDPKEALKGDPGFFQSIGEFLKGRAGGREGEETTQPDEERPPALTPTGGLNPEFLKILEELSDAPSGSELLEETQGFSGGGFR